MTRTTTRTVTRSLCLAAVASITFGSIASAQPAPADDTFSQQRVDDAMARLRQRQKEMEGNPATRPSTRPATTQPGETAANDRLEDRLRQLEREMAQLKAENDVLRIQLAQAGRNEREVEEAARRAAAQALEDYDRRNPYGSTYPRGGGYYDPGYSTAPPIIYRQPRRVTRGGGGAGPGGEIGSEPITRPPNAMAPPDDVSRPPNAIAPPEDRTRPPNSIAPPRDNVVTPRDDDNRPPNAVAPPEDVSTPPNAVSPPPVRRQPVREPEPRDRASTPQRAEQPR
jgi:hypothetical protein